MEAGWVKIHRKIREHWIWSDSNYLKWWLDLIMLANHKPAKILINSKLVSIDQGMYHTSVEKLSERWSVDRKAVFRFFDLLAEDSMITIKKADRTGQRLHYAIMRLIKLFATMTGQRTGHQKRHQKGYRRDIGGT